MRMIRSFFLMGAAMLVACLAFAPPTFSMDRMHDPGLYAAPSAVLDEIPAPLTTKDFVRAADVEVASIDRVGHADETKNAERIARTGEGDLTFIDLHMRC